MIKFKVRTISNDVSDVSMEDTLNELSLTGYRVLTISEAFIKKNRKWIRVVCFKHDPSIDTNDPSMNISK